MKTYTVNLDLPPDKRWEFLKDHTIAINNLFNCYLNDFKGEEFIFEHVLAHINHIIPKEYLEEITYISSICSFTADEILIANLYYDILKFYFGCTAFAVYNNTQMLHARNLDWHTVNDLLSKHSCIFNFTKNNKVIYKTVGWPGFISALSGMRLTSFSLTLNAVLSNDSPQITMPISFLLREVLATCSTYEAAKIKLEETSIISDCLILLSGTTENQMSVIERTPTRFSTRVSRLPYIVVTNDYKDLENHTNDINLLQTTSCYRYDTTLTLLHQSIPKNEKECFSIL